MFKRWLNKRRLAKFNAVGVTWDFQLANQDVLPVFNGSEPGSLTLDRLTIATKCGTVEKLLDTLWKYRDALVAIQSVPRVKGISLDKGGVQLTTYLTKADGYPYQIAVADRQLRDVLTDINQYLGVIREQEETKYSYYCRALKSLVTEAIEFRRLLNDVNRN